MSDPNGPADEPPRGEPDPAAAQQPGAEQEAHRRTGASAQLRKVVARPPAERPADPTVAARPPAATPPRETAGPPAPRPPRRPPTPPASPASAPQGGAARRVARATVRTPRAGRVAGGLASSSARAAMLSSTSQEGPLEANDWESDRLGLALALLLRGAGVVWMAAALVVWARLIGYLEADLTPAWHAPDGPWLSTIVSAVGAPIVAVGLWLVASWGAVLWVMAVATEVALTALAPDDTVFGTAGVAVNAVLLVAAGTLALVRHRRNRELND